MPRATLRVVPTVPTGAGRCTAATEPLLLVLPGDVPSQAWRNRDRLPGPSGATAAYRVETVQCASESGIEGTLRHHAPRVVLMDVELCERLGLAALRHLHRLHPETDWLLGWREPSPRWVQVLLHSQARGCIEWSACTDHLAHALHAVITGDLWFPRAVSQWLYAALLGAAGHGETALPHAGTEPFAEELSGRESEVMALMRQGLTNKQIGDRLVISVNTVKKHLMHAFEKRGLHSRRQELG